MQSACFITKDYQEFSDGVDGFSINTSSIFFWNRYNIWYLPINREKVEMKTLGLVVDPEEQ